MIHRVATGSVVFAVSFALGAAGPVGCGVCEGMDLIPAAFEYEIVDAVDPAAIGAHLFVEVDPRQPTASRRVWFAYTRDGRELLVEYWWPQWAADPLWGL